MRRRAWPALVLAVAVAVVLAGSARDARACGPYGMIPSYSAPGSSAAVPKNIPAVYVFPGWSYSTTCNLTSVGLAQAPATPLALTPSTIDPNVLLLAGELEAGSTYVLEHSGSCANNGLVQNTFVATEAAPLPAKTGKLEIVASGTGPTSWSAGSCGWSDTTAWVRFRLRPSCELVPFLPVTRFTTTVDGAFWGASLVGWSDGTLDTVTSRTVDLVFVSCDGGTSPLGSVKPGHLVLSLAAHVVGAATDPEPASLALDFDCDVDASASPPPQPADGMIDLTAPCISDFDAAMPGSGGTNAGPPDASQSDAPAGTGGSLSTDAGADVSTAGSAGSAVPSPSTQRGDGSFGGGCSVDGSTPRSTRPLALLVAAVVFARRRRNGHRRRSAARARGLRRARPGARWAHTARLGGAALLLLACGGQVADRPPDGLVGAGGVGAAEADAGSAGFGAALDEPWDAMVDGASATPEELCAMVGTPLPNACTEGELSYRLSRRWWQCSGQFVFNTEDAVGIEFTADGRWHLLTLDAGGVVLQGSGASYEGTWDMSGSSSSCDIQVNIHQGGTLGSFPVFTKQPSTVNLNTGGDGGAPVYVAIP